jgi:pimeloyl-ACP methyl ester carboxylesterase
MKRRTFLTTLAVGSAGLSVRALSKPSGATFVVAHGAWSAGWAWKKMHPLLTAAGHQLFTPTYTGLGERSHLADPSNSLETHINDVLGVLTYEDLRDVILVGHSYGGVVATGVADRAADRLSKLVYLDAFVPRDGQAHKDLIGPEAYRRMKEAAAVSGDGWRVPSNPIPSDTSDADRQWIEERRGPQAIKSFETPLHLRNGETKLPRYYVYCKRAASGDVFRQFADRARRESWGYFEMDASHSPFITAPEALTTILDTIAKTV